MAKERIDKIFSNLGILSRSECKAAVKAGEIFLNGQRCRTADEKADPDTDEISYQGRIVDARRFVYYMLNKPAGCITAREDRRCATVFDYIEDGRTDLSAVGRLDKDTTGILLITNDGDLNHRLLSPRYHVPKTYQVVADGMLCKADIALLERGLDIGDDRPTLPAQCRIIKEGPPVEAELILTEGRFHQVKRMFLAVGKPVLKLHRSSFGPLRLDKALRPGECRPLTEQELEQLNRAAGREPFPDL